MNAFRPKCSHHSPPKGSSDRSLSLLVALLPLLHGAPVRQWALLVFAVFLIASLVAPSILAPLNRLWTQFGRLLHRIVSPIALGILYYGVVTPTGLLMRLFGKDPLRLKLDREAFWADL